MVYEPFDPQTGVSSSSFQLECPRGMGGNKVALEVALVRFAEVPVLRALIQCSQCRAGESRTEDKASDTWFCVACAGIQYVMDPDNAAHSCQSCPAGGSCNGSDFTPLPGSEWERDDAAGVYRILGCAAGSFIVTAPYRLQACLPCQAGYYCPGGAAPALKYPANTFALSAAATNSTILCDGETSPFFLAGDTFCVPNNIYPAPNVSHCVFENTWQDVRKDNYFYRTGGLGKMMRDGWEVWVCMDHPCCTNKNDKVCFTYNVVHHVFVPWGYNSHLHIFKL